ncbi:MAG TPA: HEAT repeat domain-containing protein [Vicinamibacterales bacterium]|nr:HEAT repeat domain-containing protein [Vicinamibacterales bacterium]
MARVCLIGAAVVGLPAIVLVQTPDKPPVKPGEVTQLTAEEARKRATDDRQAASIRLADGLELNVWAPSALVADTLAIDLDANGVAYVASTPRATQWLDTRQHPDWVLEIQRLQTTEDLRQFFREKMATSLSDKNTWITDFNHDGVHDYRDLMGVPERIFKVEDTNGDGIADKSTVVFEGFNEDIAADILAGIMVRPDGDVYATIAPDLWRLRDTNGDGVLDAKESISHGYSVHPSFSGHDMSGLTQGPDGMIYWKIGEIGMNVVDKTGKRWAFPHTGAVLRANPDGSDFEVYAYGVRNPQEMAFDDYGDLISADNDGDYPGENERIIYIAEGSDTGWRSTWQYGKYTDPNNNRYNPWIDERMSKVRFPEQASYITPPIAPFTSGPSGFAYNPGTALDPSWKSHFFVTSYTGSATTARTFGFTLNPKGAGFELGEMKQMMQGVLAPGMKIGPDGAIYLTDWVLGWVPSGQGRVWKLDSVAGKGSPARVEAQALLKENFASRSAPQVVDLLRHEDQRVRLKAQFELVRRGDRDALATAAASTQVTTRDGQLSRIHAIWGLGQLLRSGSVQADALTPLLTDADPEIRAQAAKVLGQARASTAAPALMPLVQDANPRARYFATVALGRLGYRPAMPAVVAMLAADHEQDVYLRNAAVVALTGIGDRAALAALSTHESRGVRLAAVVALRRLRDPQVARFLDDADPLVVTEAAIAINDEGGIIDALPALARVLDRPAISGAPLVRRAISANLRVGDAAATTRVAAYARRAGVPDPLKVEAIATLGVWAAPSNMDRVDGSWIAPLGQRDASTARTALTELASLMTDTSVPPAVKVAWLDAVAKLDMKAQAGVILTRLQSDPDASVRVAALAALQTLAVPELETGARAAMADADATVRTAAIAALPQMSLAPAAKVELLSATVRTGTTSEQQSALRALANVPGNESIQALGRLGDDLKAGTVAPAVQLDLLEAMQATKAAPLQQRLDQLKVGRDLANVGTVFPQALTTGGSLIRGRQVAMTHAAAQCTRCHALGDSKADVGPNLAGVASRLTRAQLLEALIAPSARIAPGYGQVSVTLENGQKLEGMLREESATTIAVEDSTKGLQRVAKADIATRTNAPSAMPPMNLLLTPREIRDVVEFLSSLR